MDRYGRSAMVPVLAALLLAGIPHLGHALVLNTTNSSSPTIMSSMSAHFGPQLPYSVSAPMKSPNPVYGCIPISPGQVNGSIALIFRGGCPFSTKVQNAEAAGAVGVVIGDSYGRSYLVKMSAARDSGDVGIPAAFIRGTDHWRLRQWVNAGLVLEATMDERGEVPFTPPSWWNTGQRGGFLPWVWVVIAFALPLTYLAFRCCTSANRVARRRVQLQRVLNLGETLPLTPYKPGEEQDTDGGVTSDRSDRSSPLPASADLSGGSVDDTKSGDDIKDSAYASAGPAASGALAGPSHPLPGELRLSGESSQDGPRPAEARDPSSRRGSLPPGKVCYNETCTVCLEKFVVGEPIKVLPQCYHGFHADCITPWFERADTCPVCKYIYTPHVAPVTQRAVCAECVRVVGRAVRVCASSICPPARRAARVEHKGASPFIELRTLSISSVGDEVVDEKKVPNVPAHVDAKDPYDEVNLTDPRPAEEPSEAKLAGPRSGTLDRRDSTILVRNMRDIV